MKIKDNVTIEVLKPTEDDWQKVGNIDGHLDAQLCECGEHIDIRITLDKSLNDVGGGSFMAVVNVGNIVFTDFYS